MNLFLEYELRRDLNPSVGKLFYSDAAYVTGSRFSEHYVCLIHEVDYEFKIIRFRFIDIPLTDFQVTFEQFHSRMRKLSETELIKYAKFVKRFTSKSCQEFISNCNYDLRALSKVAQ